MTRRRSNYLEREDANVNQPLVLSRVLAVGIRIRNVEVACADDQFPRATACSPADTERGRCVDVRRQVVADVVL